MVLDSRAYRWCAIAVLGTLLCVPLAGRILAPPADVSDAEQRYLQPAPALPASWADLAAFPVQMEAHLNDTFGLRPTLVTANSLLHLGLGMSASERFLVGRNGWFFHKSTDNVLQQARGVDVFQRQELERWVREMERRQRHVERLGAAFFVVVAPNKHAIYPEHLPDWAEPVGSTRYEQLQQRLAQGSPLRLIDLHAPLRAAKLEQPVYFKTDGHWNDLGALVAYREIALRIKRRHPRVRVLRDTDLEVRWEREPIGTITLGLGLRDFVQEDVPHVELRGESNVVDVEMNEALPVYHVDQVVVTRSRRRRMPRIMMIRDSYAEPVARLMRETASDMMLVHHRFGDIDYDQIRRFRPDVVLYFFIERGLAWPLRKS